MVDLVGDNLLGAVARRGGSQRVFKPAAPAAGSPQDFLVPGQHIYEVLGGSFTLTNALTAATFAPAIAILDGDGTPIFTIAGTTLTPASSSQQANFAVDSSSGYASSFFEVPKLMLYPGFTFRLTATGINASAAISNAVLWVNRLPFGDGGRLMTGLGPEEG